MKLVDKNFKNFTLLNIIIQYIYWIYMSNNMRTFKKI